uniref:ARAD1D29194p n=1 Tax=Blastobotrys adeninivorans TaxID=409370 RepID=A0A060TBR1_BLAAD
MNKEKTLEAANALLEYINRSSNTPEQDKTSLLDEEEANDIYVQINTKKFLSDKKSLKPKRVEIPHPIYSKEETSVCLFSKDPQRSYKDVLQSENSPTKDLITRVVGVSKLKGKFKAYEARRQLYSSYDLFLADDNVVSVLPKLLGKAFYDRSVSKIPLAVRIRSGDSISAERALKEVNSILNSTMFTIPVGTTVSVKVGTSSHSAEQIQENVLAVVDYFTSKVAKKGLDDVRTIEIKSNSSPGLPIFATTSLYTEEDIAKEGLDKAEKRKRDETSQGLTRLEKALAEVVDDEELERFTKKPIRNTETTTDEPEKTEDTKEASEENGKQKPAKKTRKSKAK